jgi:hypothetical protein
MRLSIYFRLGGVAGCPEQYGLQAFLVDYEDSRAEQTGDGSACFGIFLFFSPCLSVLYIM